MIFVTTVKYHYYYHLYTDARHCLPYKRYAAANIDWHWVSTYYVTGIRLSDLNTLSYLITTNETTHFTVEEMEI